VLKDVIQCSRLTDHGILLEYQLPLSSRRLDCMLCGKDADRHARAVVVELKVERETGSGQARQEYPEMTGCRGFRACCPNRDGAAEAVEKLFGSVRSRMFVV